MATKEHKSPFDYCDVVTTTTHKTLRGPRAGMIFYRKDARGFENKINNAVFPALQGGPHEHQIAGIATQLKEVSTDKFKQYVIQMKANATTLAQALMDKGYTMATNGTDNHLILWDLRPEGVTGSKMEKLCDLVCITLNKNAVLGDRSALTPGGVRIGTPALTSRGFTTDDFEKVATFLDRTVKLCAAIQKTTGKKLVDFLAAAKEDPFVTQLRHDVIDFATTFDMPGFDVKEMTITEKY